MTNYRKTPKNIAKLAELAAENYCHDIMGCKRTVPAVKAKWQRQDMFSCDVLGKRADGSLVAIQVTSGQSCNVSQRKRKIEKEFWHSSDTVQILQLVKEEGTWWFKVYEYWLTGDVYEETNEYRAWTIKQLIPVPKHWFKKWKEGAK